MFFGKEHTQTRIAERLIRPDANNPHLSFIYASTSKQPIQVNFAALTQFYDIQKWLLSQADNTLRSALPFRDNAHLYSFASNQTDTNFARSLAARLGRTFSYFEEKSGQIHGANIPTKHEYLLVLPQFGKRDEVVKIIEDIHASTIGRACCTGVFAVLDNNFGSGNRVKKIPFYAMTSLGHILNHPLINDLFVGDEYILHRAREQHRKENPNFVFTI